MLMQMSLLGFHIREIPAVMHPRVNRSQYAFWTETICLYVSNDLLAHGGVDTGKNPQNGCRQRI